MEHLKSAILKNTLEFFKNILKLETEIDIKINEEKLDKNTIGWGTKFYSKKGAKVSLIPSTGENQILLISYIISIFSNLDIRLPIFLDSGFSTLDYDNRMRLIEVLHQVIKGGQVILTGKNTDFEYKDLLTSLRQKAGNEYNFEVITRFFENKINEVIL